MINYSIIWAKRKNMKIEKRLHYIVLNKEHKMRLGILFNLEKQHFLNFHKLNNVA